MTKCLNCNKDISQTEGKKARIYCGDACRIAYKRTTISEQMEVKSEQIISEQPKANKPKQVYTEQGRCHGCGIEVKHYICICYECVHAGITHKSLKMDISRCE